MRSKPESVRIADYRDESALYDLLVDLHKENQYGWGHPFHEGLVRAKIETATRPRMVIEDKATGRKSYSYANRTNPQDTRVGTIGVIGRPGERLIATVGLFSEPLYWFTLAPDLVETWLYVRPEYRARRDYQRDLFAFSLWVHAKLASHEAMKPQEYGAASFDLLTGFIHAPYRAHPTTFEAMRRLWRRYSGAEQIGALFRHK